MSQTLAWHTSFTHANLKQKDTAFEVKKVIHTGGEQFVITHHSYSICNLKAVNVKLNGVPGNRLEAFGCKRKGVML